VVDMPFGWGGRGYRWMYWLTGLPGWARFGYPWSYAWWRCRFFPWLPRWWWTGMYGPIEWTPEGPRLVTSTTQSTSAPQSITTLQPPTFSREEELNYLKEEVRMLEEERKALEREIEELRKRIEELEKKG